MPGDCRNKYAGLQNRERKKGPFTAEEDELIRTKVSEWGDQGVGLWKALEKEMNRDGRCISQRWLLISSSEK